MKARAKMAGFVNTVYTDTSKTTRLRLHGEKLSWWKGHPST